MSWASTCRIPVKDYIEAFNKGYGKEGNSKIGKFVRNLRKICAILANTSEGCCNKDGKYFGYKGKCEKEKDDILSSLASLNNNGKSIFSNDLTVDKNKKRILKPHCKLEEKKEDNECGYEILKKQLRAWRLEKAKVVIAGIEEMAKVLTEDGK